MSDIHELTPWEEINPPMASARRHAPQSQFSDDDRAVFRNELTACLTLVAPVGMTEEARRDWFAVAWEALKHLPPDILRSGAQKARQQCDHPSKIVPTIIAETADWMKLRTERHPAHLYLPSPTKRNVMDRRGEPMSEEDTVELNRVLEFQGAIARYRPDGSRYLIEAS